MEDDLDADRATSSSEDFYGDEQQQEHEDAVSVDMELSSSSRDSSPEAVGSSLPPIGEKRKAMDPSDDSADVASALEKPVKKRKLSRSQAPPADPLVYGLTDKIWQRVFCYLSPAMLARCTRVCRLFRLLLVETEVEPRTKQKQERSSPACLNLLDSQRIWSVSRRSWFPSMPSPIFSEWETMRFLHVATCEFCNRGPAAAPATNPFSSGPGPDGVRIVWPFTIRCCGRCLESRVMKDVDVLLSPAKHLRQGLPHAFLTDGLHLVPSILFQQPKSRPVGVTIRKVFYNDDLQRIVEDAKEKSSLGPAAFEGWREGLPGECAKLMTFFARWEKWESQVRLGKDLAQVLRESDPSSFPTFLHMVQSRSAGSNGTHPSLDAHGYKPSALPASVNVVPNGFAGASSLPAIPPQQAPRPVRTQAEAAADRQVRRAEIERRCLELEPPLMPDVLPYIDAFNATIKITWALTDIEWTTMVKPRILAQREAAELAAHQHREQLAALQASMPTTITVPFNSRPAKKSVDKEYDSAQEPLRKRLGEYADEYTKVRWTGGELHASNVPLLAVQTMQFVRQKYLQDAQAGLLPTGLRRQPASASRDDSPTSDTSARDAFLSLDNMKWVFDHKLRPLTDVHRKDLFLCAPCVEEGIEKWLPFEGLIQHCGARHEYPFGNGNIVVQWRTAEWPEDSPFHLRPNDYIRQDRKVFEQKSYGRPKKTPQNGRDGPFRAPVAGILLSENPLFSGANQVVPRSSEHEDAPTGLQPNFSGRQSSVLGFHVQASPATVPPPHDLSHSFPAFVGNSLTSSPGQRDNNDDEDKLGKLSNDMGHLWYDMNGMQDLLTCVRVQVVLHHAIRRFENEFHQKPSLDLITVALAAKPLVEQMKNAFGLTCKSCVASQPKAVAENPSYHARVEGVKAFTTTSLISHFQVAHGQNVHTCIDNMLELPEQEIITDMIQDSGMNDVKLLLIAGAFPALFPSPLPSLEALRVKASKAKPLPETQMATSQLVDRSFKKSKTSASSKKGKGGSNTPTALSKAEEYDPRRPMVMPDSRGRATSPVMEYVVDPGRYDTDVARKGSLGTDSGANGTPATAEDEDLDRSPSVGRERSPVGKLKALSGAPPNISAILSLLEGQQHAPAQPSSSTPMTARPRSGNATRWPSQNGAYTHPRPHPQYVGSPRSTEEFRQSSPHYAGAPGDNRQPITDEVARYDGQDLRSSFINPSPTYAQDPYAAPAYSPAYRQPSSVLPQHAQPAPVQYYRAAAAAAAPPPPPPPPIYPVYDPHPRPMYQQPPSASPGPVYVDEHGNPVRLVAVDAGPAPVQYAPLPPYEQRRDQYGRPW